VLLIDELERDRRYSATALRQVGRAISAARTESRQLLASTLPIKKFKRLARQLEREGKLWEAGQMKSRKNAARWVDRAWLWAADARVARRASRVRSAIAAAGIVYAPQRVHKLRLEVKKLRYAVELLAEARPRQGADRIETLRAFQDTLGRLHDLETLREWIREIQASPASCSDFTEWKSLNSLERRVEADCRQLHAVYVRDRAQLTTLAAHLGGVRLQHIPAIRAAS
jgi:CHAD domain-containing protein